MPDGNAAAAALELRIGACAKIARVHRDRIDGAMKDGAPPFFRDNEGNRVTTWDALTAWLGRNGEPEGRRHGR